ncbi:MAG TPA: cyclic nucleotide-binding and patatin-like phospholipase domain-containing protein [Desulfomonilia bacterium]|nr:cyclic nucleotide-binding and patatin-like phospholipase domain-containing protein [Desulfomonilia bacterium]
MKSDKDGLSKEALSELIRSNPFWAAVSDSIIEDLLPSMEYVHIKQGETLIRQGDISEAMYVVVKGNLQAVSIQPDETEIPLGKIGPGEPIGEIQILAGGKNTASVLALSDAEVVKFSKTALENLLHKSPDLVSVLADISKRRLLHNQLANILPTLFGPLDDTMLQDIEDQVEWLHVPGGETLFREGEPGDALYIVLCGRLRVVAKGDNKSEKVLGEVAMGESVGEMALFTDEPRSATVYATRDSELVKISQGVFERITRQYPQLPISITKILIGRLRKNINRSCPVNTGTNIAVVPISPSVSFEDFTHRLVSSLSSLGSTLHLSSKHIEDLLHTPGIASSPEDGPGNIRLLSWLNEQETKYPFILFEADREATPWTRRCLRQADHILLIADVSDVKDSSRVDPMLLPSQKGSHNARRSIVLIHKDGNTLPTGTRKWLDQWKVEDHHHIRWNGDEDFMRLARFMAGCTTSLVLSGGGARGLAHIGVIRALRESGIEIDMVGGASMGAVIASGYAMDLDDRSLHRKAWESFVRRKPFSDYTFPFISLVKCAELDSIIKDGYGDIQIEDLWINYFCVSSNLSTAELVIHRRDSLSKAIRASASVPGIAAPVIEGNHLLVDGGVLNNLPIDIMRGFCAGKIIAADVSEEEDLTITQKDMPSPWRMFLSRLLPFLESIRFPNIFDVLMRTAVLSSVSQRNQMVKDVDLYLRPPVHGYKLLDFNALDDLIEIGYRHTKEKLKGWSG